MGNLKTRLLIMIGVMIGALIQFVTMPILAGDLQTLRVSYEKPVILTISSQGINRISFANLVINKIVGDQADLTVQALGSGSELFVTSKRDSGEVINCAAVLANGKVIDLQLKIQKLAAPKIIRLSFTDATSGDLSDVAESQEMLSSMKKGTAGKYYVTEIADHISIPAFKSLKARQVRMYRYGDLYGAVIAISNSGKASIVLRAARLAGLFDKTITATIDAELIGPRESTNAYIIFRRGQDV